MLLIEFLQVRHTVCVKKTLPVLFRSVLEWNDTNSVVFCFGTERYCRACVINQTEWQWKCFFDRYCRYMTCMHVHTLKNSDIHIHVHVCPFRVVLHCSIISLKWSMYTYM